MTPPFPDRGHPSPASICFGGAIHYLDLIADSPAIRFLSKAALSAGAIHRLLATGPPET